MASQKMFNTIAKKTTDELARYKKAIALMKELQSWGPDAQGRSFTFEVFQWPYGFDKKTMILASYATPAELARGTKISALLIGLETHRSDEFRAQSSWYSAHGKTVEQKAGEVLSHGGALYTCTAETVDKSVIGFAELRMNEHPRYKAAIKAAADKVVQKTKQKPVI